jgi:hypothetical protein
MAGLKTGAPEGSLETIKAGGTRKARASPAALHVLVFDQNTIEGPIYSLIYDTVNRVKEIIEGIEKI